ncbi:MAG: TonB-dependent receptor [Dysgonamonadaceae bacterium]|jgi:outer membrane receptor for ferrienterochelin and colicins|nr:TonB-dependent receptor [Dysgonamonadaceae bacterium]
MSKYAILFSFTFFLYALTVRAQQKELETDSLSDGHYLNEVVVTGTMTPRALKNTPVLTKVISGNEIRQSGATTLVEALENFVPGVSFIPNQAMGDNIQIQGVDNKYILILIDGERLVGERTEKVNLSRLNTSDIKQVEIVSGASSALYGSSAIGSVINIITRDVDKPLQGDARFRRSNYLDVIDASLGFKVKNFSSKTSFTRKDMDAYEVKNTSYTANPYEDYSLSQLFKYKNNGFSAELKGNYYNQENWLLEKYQTRVDENYTLGGKLQYVFSPKNTLTLSGNSDNYEGKMVYKLRSDSTVRANASQYSSFRLTDVWNATDKIQVAGGMETNFENVFSYNQFDTQDKKQASNWNLFAQGEFKTETGLGALLGARYIRHSRFGGYLAPNMSLMYRLDNFRFRSNISNGFKTPTLKELYMEFPHRIGENLPFWIIGNESLAPEESWYKAVSAEYLDNSLNVSVTAYDNSIRNKINTVTFFNEALDRTEMRYENVEEVRITGLETSLQYAFLKHFQLRGGYAFTNAVDKTTRQQLSGNSRHTATASLTFRQPHLPFLPSTEKWSYNMLLSARAMSPRTVYSENDGNVTELSTGSYHTVHFVYTQHFPVYKDLRGDFQFGVSNLTDNINRDFAEYNPGRTYFVSLGIKY